MTLSPVPSPVDVQRVCAWCKASIGAGGPKRRDAKFCSTRCRQNSHRFRVEASHGPADATARPLRFAYADPPYPGKSFYYPERQEVDHASLLQRLRFEYPDGWALSTSSVALRGVLRLCPEGVRVCAWFKGPRPTRSRRALTSWEPLIVAGGRPLRIDVVQDLSDGLTSLEATGESLRARGDGLIARGRHRAFPGALVGMKPPAFCEWMFRQLGAASGDELVDLFPGSGAVGEAWRRFVGVAPRVATA